MNEKAKEMGFIPYIGEGTTIFNALHVKDIVRFLLLLVSESTKKAEGSVYERCFIIGGQNIPWKTAANAFAASLHSIGVIESPIAKSVKLSEAGSGEIPMLMASDMRFTGPRAERLGFRNTEETLLEFLKRKDIFPASQ
jgi:hypothetical protein